MKRFDLVVPRKYEVNGEEKTQWQNCGVVFEKDGKMWGEVRSIPVNWDGRFQLFEPKQEAQGQQSEIKKVVEKVKAQGFEPQDDDFPF
jgi:hypothetical protein